MYQAGIYCRVSVEELIKESKYSNSIHSQIKINPVYTGAIVLRKLERPSYKLKYKKIIPLEERELCENAHEAIITKKQFDEVQQILKQRRVPSLDRATAPHKYSGLLFCGKCGYAMRKRYLESHGGYDGYMCSSHQLVRTYYCELNHIVLEKLDELVAFAINQQIKSVKEEWKKLSNEIKRKKNESSKQQEKLKIKIEKNKEYKKKVYEQYMDEVLNKEEYLSLKSMYEQENIQCQSEWMRMKEKMKVCQQAMDETVKWLEKFQYGKITEKQLTKELLGELIEKINIFPDQQIEIFFRFGDPLEEGRN